MDRRIDLHPRRKLRNPSRHLRSLANWASDPCSWLPENNTLENWAYRFWHYKLPVYEKLVSPHHTTPEIKATVAQSLLDAAGNIRTSTLLRRKFRVACLINPDGLFESEVTIFFDDGYFRTFLPPSEYGATRKAPFTISTEPATMDLVRAWGLTVPNELVDFGGYLISAYEDGEANTSRAMHHWVFAEAGFQQSKPF